MPPADALSPDAVFARAMAFVLRYEGGYSEHPADPGGATNHGISLRYAVKLGRLLDLDRDGDVDAADIRLITPKIAADLYRKDFWWAVRAERLPAAMALVAFDAAINCGPGRAAGWLQGAVGAAQDGAIGPKTIAAAAAHPDPAGAVQEMLAQRIVHHADLPTWRNFGLGWSRRIAALALLAAEFLPHRQEPASS
jgi:lysozyme family protein